MLIKSTILTLLLVCIAACTSSSNPNYGRYSQHKDSAPKAIKDGIKFDDAEPMYEPYALANLRSYSVLGKHYTPLKTGKGYSATGGASWYGQKFHGHLTSNGETYDMYAMTAAHKTLPLPSYVKVTNLKNGREAIVRVNDRGPFHDNRIIDLSYAAAMKLGMLSTGTTQVKLEVIHIDETGTQTVGNGISVPPAPLKNDSVTNDKVQIASAPKVPALGTTTEVATSGTVRPPTTIGLPSANVQQDPVFIQIAALTNNQRIHKIGNALASLYQVPFVAPLEEGLYRLRLGPFDSDKQANGILEQLRTTGYGDAYKFYPMN
ncbi:Endolytic peptidoglycan transglycosylase RlpA [Paraglaciecola mesophila]|uniref:Endolytic peptidoglycan transglycosylase RlpA n=1 Tax=Paraglaciecola mesophila TaxID=197222 RepID=A0A857JJP3_9ALTE|nr:septal ring lytic transglycosylase RlpA family protein [Paraglaciecola mesophila]QHJ10854.1 Endolytic peptidoglycan transglycosylase RlpA [Paraglaciecola mesophila]